MRLSRPLPAAILALGALLAGTGVLTAQMEAGERGILPIDSSGTLEITGIHVDVGGKDAMGARLNGWRIAQREGFKALWAKTNNRPIAQAPNLSDSVLDGLVSSIIVEKEQIGPNRYIADLGILFDRARAGQLLGVGGEVQRSAPMLLVPILVTGGTATSVETRNPWQRAWAQFRTAQSPIDYVRVSGLGADPLLVNAAQTRRPGRGWWRNIIDFYGAADILIAEVQYDRLYPGGPAIARFIARHGPDGEILGGFTLKAKDSAGLDRMMADGVQRMDALFAEALAAGRLRRDPSLIIQAPPPIIEEEAEAPAEALAPVRIHSVQVVAPDSSALQAGIAMVRAIPGVETVSENSLAIGSVSNLMVSYRGDLDALRAQIIARGWSVEVIGGALRLTRPSGAPPPAASPAGDGEE